MVDFNEWFENRHGKQPHHFTEDYANYTYLKHELKKAWYFQQKKIDEIDKHFQSLISESELWGFSSDQATRQIELIQELLK